MNYVNADLLAHLKSVMYEATQQAQFAPGQTPQSNPTSSTSAAPQPSGSESFPPQSQDSSSKGSAVDRESESATSPGEEGEGKS